MMNSSTVERLEASADDRKQVKESSDRKWEQTGKAAVQLYSVVMSFRARSSSSLRALPFSF